VGDAYNFKVHAITCASSNFDPKQQIEIDKSSMIHCTINHHFVTISSRPPSDGLHLILKKNRKQRESNYQLLYHWPPFRVGKACISRSGLMAIGAISVLFSLPAALVCSRGTIFLTQDLHMKLANSKCGQLVIVGRFSCLWAMLTIFKVLAITCASSNFDPKQQIERDILSMVHCTINHHFRVGKPVLVGI
jgi:hypothetical protein